MFAFRTKVEMPTAEPPCPGVRRRSPPPVSISSMATRSRARTRKGLAMAIFGLGCFWGAERKFWELGDGVWVTAVGYAGGLTPNPTYEEVCSGRTGHNEVVLVVYDPNKISFEQLLKTFWESHDPTQGMRQGNDVGTQYRSGIYVFYAGAARGRRSVAGGLCQGARGGRHGRDHDGNPRCAAILFCRGLSPAISGEEPARLLRPRRHRRELPDRHRRRRALTLRGD